MQEDKCVYQIGEDEAGVVVTLICLVVFGILAIWLAYVEHPAALFVGPLALMILVMASAIIYRHFIMKFLVGENGFYHRSRPGNGRYHRYSELEKAWTSYGDGNNALYFYYQLPGEPPVRFFYNLIDDEAVEYMLSKFRSFHPELEEENEDWDYDE